MCVVVEGTLMNSAVSDVVATVLMLDDIREDDAQSVGTLLSLFCDRLRSEVISEISSVTDLPLSKLVPSWARLHEIR